MIEKQIQHHVWVKERDGLDYSIPITDSAHRAYHLYNKHTGKNGTGDHNLGNIPHNRNRYGKSIDFYVHLGLNVSLQETLWYFSKSNSLNYSTVFKPSNEHKLYFIEE